MAQVETLADRRAEVEVKTLSVTVAELEANKLLHTLGDRLEEIQVETTQRETKRLVHAQVNTIREILYQVRAKAIIEAPD